MLGRNTRKQDLIFQLQAIGMKCQILFSGKNSTELAQRIGSGTPLTPYILMIDVFVLQF